MKNKIISKLSLIAVALLLPSCACHDPCARKIQCAEQNDCKCFSDTQGYSNAMCHGHSKHQPCNSKHMKR